ncbi:hypothetical protein DKM44_09190 [Deinococcus irradiatisoli]|uniref:Uncharacterized protein n=2 Tax=Deinococcus irradiatisoli TaxID=2202254 RepID=A0A2Z3JEB9_9DEIO|nr:hypothetical protein DKM44_09190 [Deinococcus irradiatisoli]
MLALRRGLGDYLDRNRLDGVFEVWACGPGSLDALSDLEAPELHAFVLPDPLSGSQQEALRALGYRPADQPSAEPPRRWIHPGGWTLVLGDVSRLDALERQALSTWLAINPDGRQRYRAAFQRAGRAEAEALCLPQALAAALDAEGFGPLERLTQLLSALEQPWMFASGWALEVWLQRRTRLHHDLDVVVPVTVQRQLHALLAPEWRLDACVNGEYYAWHGEPFDGFQVHARRPGWPMLDVMFSDLSGPLWHYRRDPQLTLPLERARRMSHQGWPYLAPEAVLLFKAGRSGHPPRSKDLEDFGRIVPTLDAEARQWLAAAIGRGDPVHPWLSVLA